MADLNITIEEFVAEVQARSSSAADQNLEGASAVRFAIAPMWNRLQSLGSELAVLKQRELDKDTEPEEAKEQEASPPEVQVLRDALDSFPQAVINIESVKTLHLSVTNITDVPNEPDPLDERRP